MKKILIAFGAGILTTAALFAGKPSTTVHTIYYTVAGVCRSFSVPFGTTNFTTGNFPSNQAAIVTRTNGTSVSLWGACISGSSISPVHFNP